MSDQQVVYELNLKDGLSAGVDKAAGHVKHLESNMGELKEKILGVAEAFGISFAIFKGIEFVHEGIESMEKLHQVEAQLQNTMENMGTYTEESFEKIINSSKQLASGIKFSTSDVIELRSQLGLVGTIGEEEMGRITKVSADLASKMGMGLTEAGNLLAKAINAPEMARRLGMALKIDPAVMEHIQALARHGKEVQARMELLAIAEDKVGGAAKAAFDADPLSRYEKTMASVKNTVGDLAIDVLKALTPALEDFASVLKDGVVWLKEHKKLLSDIGIIIAVVTGAYIAYKTALLSLIAVEKIQTTWIWIQLAAETQAGVGAGVLSVWMTILTAAQWAWNAAMDANPIGLLIAAIAAVIITITLLARHFGVVKASLLGVWETVKEFGRIVGDVFMGVAKVIHGALHLNPSEVSEGFHQTVDAISNAGNRLGHAFKKGYDDGMAEWDKDHAPKEESSLLPKGGKKPTQFPKADPKTPKTQAQGSKIVNITVHINKITGIETMQTTTIKESMTEIRKAIIETLSSAVNDFQIVADH